VKIVDYSNIVRNGFAWAVRIASVPKDGREGLANKISVRMGNRMNPYDIFNSQEVVH
jgi:hypothetical protein